MLRSVAPAAACLFEFTQPRSSRGSLCMPYSKLGMPGCLSVTPLDDQCARRNFAAVAKSCCSELVNLDVPVVSFCCSDIFSFWTPFGEHGKWNFQKCHCSLATSPLYRMYQYEEKIWTTLKKKYSSHRTVEIIAAFVVMQRGRCTAKIPCSPPWRDARRRLQNRQINSFCLAAAPARRNGDTSMGLKPSTTEYFLRS